MTYAAESFIQSLAPIASIVIFAFALITSLDLDRPHD